MSLDCPQCGAGPFSDPVAISEHANQWHPDRPVTFSLTVCRDGVEVEGDYTFDGYDETIEAVGMALQRKAEDPAAVVTLLVSLDLAPTWMARLAGKLREVGMLTAHVGAVSPDDPSDSVSVLLDPTGRFDDMGRVRITWDAPRWAIMLEGPGEVGVTFYYVNSGRAGDVPDESGINQMVAHLDTFARATGTILP